MIPVTPDEKIRAFASCEGCAVRLFQDAIISWEEFLNLIHRMENQFNVFRNDNNELEFNTHKETK